MSLSDDAVATSLSSGQSSFAYHYDSCRDLHQIPFNLPDIATSELDCVDSKTVSMTLSVAVISALPIDCTFIPLIAAFFFFLPFYLLITNW